MATAAITIALPGLAAAQQPRTAAAPRAAAIPEIPYQKFVLDNGLTVLVHEDRKAPIVAVNVWYHVGSKNERPGITGFAHLFEHLMFNGSENYNDDYFGPLEQVGATDLNGTTNADRTNYFQNVPTAALDRVLFLESDRMGHLLGAIDQARLDEQRGVVQNEKRQGENEPYGLVDEQIARATYPAGHPYSWETIGSMEDLNAASLEDVQAWFRTYYGPNNAVVVVAGDIDAETARARVEHWFGDIPPGPPVMKQGQWLAKMTGTRRGWMQDRVPQARIYKVWNVPGWGTAENDHLDLAADVLAAGKNSRLFKRLVYDEQLATDVAAYVWDRELGGQFTIMATARPGQDLAPIEKAIDEEVARLLRDGPTPVELERAKTSRRAGFVRGIERIGGFGGKSDILATNMIYAGDPAYYKVSLGRLLATTAAQVKSTANAWLSDGVYTLEVEPYPELKASGVAAARDTVPPAEITAEPRFPEFTTDSLSNGVRVIVATRASVPVVNLSLLVDAGFAADQGGTPGTASLTANMLDEGTRTRSALAISDALQRLGATLGSGANLDMHSVSMSMLADRADSSLAVFADVALNPSFPEADFKRLQQQQLAAIQREKVTPVQMALRVFPQLLYGAGHAYSVPFTGSGTEESVARITPAALAEFHRTWFKPDNATIVVVGATTMAEIKPKLERAFRGWARGSVPEKNIGTVAAKAAPEVYLVDRPGSQQSVIFAGHVAPPKRNPDEIAIGTMNDVLGGSFTSRVNMNLREDKHWSYGAFTILFDARGQRPFLVYAPVQTDKTAESVREVMSELRGIVGDRPVTPEELAKSKANLTLSLPGQWETNGAVMGSLADIVRFDLPRDYFSQYAGAVRALELAHVRSVAAATVQPENLVWVVVGDRAQIEPGLREIFGDIKLLDADGKPVQTAATP
jgi:zinc protease